MNATSPVEGLGSANVRPQGIAAGAPGLFDVVESLKPATKWGALSVTAAILLTVAMNHPYGGLMRLSAAPLQGVLAELKQ